MKFVGFLKIYVNQCIKSFKSLIQKIMGGGGGGQPHFYQFLPMPVLPKMGKAGRIKATLAKKTGFKAKFMQIF